MSALVIGPASLDLVLPRGSTPRLRVRLTSRHVRSGALIGRPAVGDTVEWRILWPGGARTASNAPGAPVALAYDPVSRVLEYPATLADLATLGDAGAPYAITIVNADGRRTRFVEGTIRAEGQP